MLACICIPSFLTSRSVRRGMSWPRVMPSYGADGQLSLAFSHEGGVRLSALFNMCRCVYADVLVSLVRRALLWVQTLWVFIPHYGIFSVGKFHMGQICIGPMGNTGLTFMDHYYLLLFTCESCVFMFHWMNQESRFQGRAVRAGLFGNVLAFSLSLFIKTNSPTHWLSSSPLGYEPNLANHSTQRLATHHNPIHIRY
jgi:hypothetical protein